MRQFTIQHTVYNFDELNEEAQEKALDELRHINAVGDFWHEFIIEDKTTELEQQGIVNVDIQFSGFWSQGDGASIAFDIQDLKQFIKHHKKSNEFKTLLNNEDVIEAMVLRASYPHYVHEKMIDGIVNIHGYLNDDMTSKQIEKLEEQAEKLEKYLTEYARSESYKLYKTLEKAYDDMTSNESVIESIKCNEYEFFEDGTIS